MSNEKYLDYAGLQYYHEKLNMDLANMTMTDDNLESILFYELDIPPAIPENWTVSSDGTLDVSLSNAYSYWPEGAGTKSISITNTGNSDRKYFFLKLTDGGNFFLEWDNSIEWQNENEPELNPFYESIFLFKKSSNKWIGQIIETNKITEYWKLTVQVSENSNIYFPFEDCDIDWGDGSVIDNTGYHTYTTTGIYQIIARNSNGFSYMAQNDCGLPNNYYDYWEYAISKYAISIDSPLPNVPGTYQWPDDHLMEIDDNFDMCFNYYDKLISIPDKLFYNVHATSFVECFSGCTSLQSIPRNLFANNPDVVSTPSTPYTSTGGFYYCFGGCSSLTSLPTELFTNNTAVTSFEGCFFGCSALTNFTLNIGSSIVTNCRSFIPKKDGTIRTINVPSGSTTQTTFNNVASSLGLTIVGV